MTYFLTVEVSGVDLPLGTWMPQVGILTHFEADYIGVT